MNALEFSSNKEASLVYRYLSDVFWSVASTDCSLALVAGDSKERMPIEWDGFCMVLYIHTHEERFVLYQAMKGQSPSWGRDVGTALLFL
jgi:hypothetical protein